jgi:hypothetical protein
MLPSIDWHEKRAPTGGTVANPTEAVHGSGRSRAQLQQKSLDLLGVSTAFAQQQNVPAVKAAHDER